MCSRKPRAKLGVNLVPIVRNFIVTIETFNPSHCAVQEGCVLAGSRKLMRFDFLSYNPGDTDLSMGRPSDNPQLYEFSPCHGHYHLKDFNEFRLLNSNLQEVIRSYKQAFCLIDVERISPNASNQPKFTSCNSNQGVQSGWADLYDRSLDCQWIDITNVSDGQYVLESTTNKNYVVNEDYYGDNTVWVGLDIRGTTVREIALPFMPEDCLIMDPASASVQNIGGRWKIVVGNMLLLDFADNRDNAEKALQIITFYRFTSQCFVGRPGRPGFTPMQYYLVNGSSPQGEFNGEDSIPFNLNNVSVQQIDQRWKIVDGDHWILDFGASEGNARKAYSIIKKYEFNRICFVGRPNPEMMYFRKDIPAWHRPWIRFLYIDLLNREPDQVGFDYWLNQLRSGASTISIVDGFLHSPEYCTLTANYLYSKFLDRTAEPAGLQYWRDILVSGVSLQDVILGFCDSPEYKSNNPVPNRFVESLYNKLLDRRSDPGGLRYWIRLLTSGTNTTTDVIRTFLVSREYAVLRITEFYRKFLGREPEPAGLDFWADKIQNRRSLQEITRGFLTSQEYINRTLSR